MVQRRSYILALVLVDTNEFRKSSVQYCLKTPV
jgi:hypothetical protein